jgi:hypothetical protein
MFMCPTVPNVVAKCSFERLGGEKIQVSNFMVASGGQDVTESKGLVHQLQNPLRSLAKRQLQIHANHALCRVRKRDQK